MKKSLFLFLLIIIFSCDNLLQEKNNTEEKINNYEENKLEKKEASQFASLPVENKIEFSTDYLMGKFDPAKNTDFVSVDKKYSDGDPYFLRKETYESFKKMWEAAKAEGINLRIISATRNFDRQKYIWERKWTGVRKIESGADASKKYPVPKYRALAILKYSSMPGTSRHHWGTDIDINNLTNEYFEKGQGKKEYDWLVANAARFGFCQPYTPKGEKRPDGYNEEKWHWSYIPVAKQLTDKAEKELQDEMITGFKGAETAVEIGVVKKYVLGINSACRH